MIKTLQTYQACIDAILGADITAVFISSGNFVAGLSPWWQCRCLDAAACLLRAHGALVETSTRRGRDIISLRLEEYTHTHTHTHTSIVPQRVMREYTRTRTHTQDIEIAPQCVMGDKCKELCDDPRGSEKQRARAHVLARPNLFETVNKSSSSWTSLLHLGSAVALGVLLVHCVSFE